MVSQGQTVATGQDQPRKLIEFFIVAVAGAAIAITLAWAVFGTLSPSVAAPGQTTMQILQDPGLLDQRAGERGGSVVVVIPSSESSINGMLEHRRGERGGAAPATKQTGTNGFNGFGNTGYPAATSSEPQVSKPGRVQHRSGPLEFN